MHADLLGIYHWGGRSKGVSTGMQEVVALNASIARITLSARMDIDYQPGTCVHTGLRLAAALDDEDVRDALRNPCLKP